MQLKLSDLNRHALIIKASTASVSASSSSLRKLVIFPLLRGKGRAGT